MNGKRRTESEDEPAARRQRAFEIFAAWLERQAELREPDEAGFTALLSEHPELHDELRSIHAGLAQFRSIRPSRLRAALDERPRSVGRRWLVRVAAAAILVTAAGVVWRFARTTKPVATPGTGAAQSPVAAALVDRGVKWLEEVVKSGGSLDKVEAAALEAAKQGSATTDSRPPEITAEVVHGIAGAYAAVRSIATISDAPSQSSALPGLAQIRASLRDAPAGSWRSEVLKEIDTRGATLEPGKPFLFALGNDPQTRALLAAGAGDSAPSEALARLIAETTQKAVLRVRAIDLDAGGGALDGATVYAQPVELPDNTLGPPQRLGVTPLPPSQLESGDWRITVVDASGAELRFSEFRLLASPGEDLGLRVAFLRTTADVTDGMAHRAACTALCGAPRDALVADALLPETTAAVEELWIDPFETTCADYSKFYLDLVRHPEWFDGPLPVHRPKVLSGDGSCPANVARRAIVDVAWGEAVLYANWAGKRLPTEREWERVARGDASERRRFPWGDPFRPELIDLSATVDHNLPAPTKDADGRTIWKVVPPKYEEIAGGEVDAPTFLAGRTPESDGDRVFRLADNVTELVEDLFVSGMAGSSPSLLVAQTVARVDKGGSWLTAGEGQSQTWMRSATMTDFGWMDEGFRCVKTAKPAFEAK